MPKGDTTPLIKLQPCLGSADGPGDTRLTGGHLFRFSTIKDSGLSDSHDWTESQTHEA